MILVTGGTGFIGGHLLERLSNEHIPARCFVRPNVGTRKLPEGIQATYGDLTTGQGLSTALEGADTVIHLAGVTAACRPEDYYIGNTRATEMLAKAAAGRPLRFVHVSSLAAVGPALDGKPVSEDSVPHPISHYGRSKLEGERLVRRFLPDAVVVRPPVVYGPRDRGVFQLLKPIARGIAVEIAGGDRWFSSIFVRDLVEGLMAAARAKQAAGRTYFLAHPKAATWNDLQTAAARIVGRRLRVIRVPIAVAHLAGRCAEAWSRASRKPGIISRDKVADAVCRYWTCDPSRAASELGFTARMPLEDGLAETLAWYKEAGWLRY